MSKTVLLDTAITEIAQIVYPSETLRDGKKKVRGVFAYASRLNRVGTIGKDSMGKPLVDRRKFEEWAAAQWPILAARFQVPVVATLQGALPSMKASVIGTSVPVGEDQLTSKFIEVSMELVCTREELNKAHEELEQLRLQAAKRDEQDTATHQKKSAAGKRGGRGRWGSQPK